MINGPSHSRTPKAEKGIFWRAPLLKETGQKKRKMGISGYTGYSGMGQRPNIQKEEEAIHARLGQFLTTSITLLHILL